MKKFFAFYKGKTLKDITTAHIAVYLKSIEEKSDASKARLKASLSSLFKYCVRVRDWQGSKRIHRIRINYNREYK